MTSRTDPAWLTDLRGKVTAHLRAQGATQGGLAYHLGITPKHVCQLLSGKVTGSPEMLDQLAAACGLRILIGQSPDPAPVLPGRSPKAALVAGAERERIAAAILAGQVRCLTHGEAFAEHPGCPACDRNGALASAAEIAAADPTGSRP